LIRNPCSYHAERDEERRAPKDAGNGWLFVAFD